MERIELGVVEHTVRRWWVRGAEGEVGHAVIGLGELAAGRWFVAKAERGTNLAWLARDERHACDVVERWLQHRGGLTLWREVSSRRGIA